MVKSGVIRAKIGDSLVRQVIGNPAPQLKRGKPGHGPDLPLQLHQGDYFVGDDREWMVGAGVAEIEGRGKLCPVLVQYLPFPLDDPLAKARVMKSRYLLKRSSVRRETWLLRRLRWK